MELYDVIFQLQNLKEHCQDMANSSPEIWQDDVNALEYAIQELQKRG